MMIARGCESFSFMWFHRSIRNPNEDCRMQSDIGRATRAYTRREDGLL